MKIYLTNLQQRTCYSNRPRSEHTYDIMLLCYAIFLTQTIYTSKTIRLSSSIVRLVFSNVRLMLKHDLPVCRVFVSWWWPHLQIAISSQINYEQPYSSFHFHLQFDHSNVKSSSSRRKRAWCITDNGHNIASWLNRARVTTFLLATL